MRERDAIVAAWTQASAAGREAVLATVVRVEGSAYRGVGARMLVLDQGERVGGVSGGCLEDELTKKAFWLTTNGSALTRFSTRSEDETRPYGMGCEGVVHILLERVRPLVPCIPIELFVACREALAPGVLATALSAVDAGATGSVALGDRMTLWPDGRLAGHMGDEKFQGAIAEVARACLRSGSMERWFEHYGARIDVAFELVEPPRSLLVFGAGDDAIPVVRIAKELGWHVTVADGRAHYATAARFPLADVVTVTRLQAPLEHIRVPRGAACVVMSHSFDQDCAVLAALAPLPIGYLGLLGPRARREAILQSLGPIHFVCEGGLHGPVGLDIGSETPESIALAIVAEAHARLAGRSGGSCCHPGPPLESR